MYLGLKFYFDITMRIIFYALSLTHLGMMTLIQAGAQDVL